MKDKLNLGCGTVILSDYVNLDSYKFRGVDVVWDLNNVPYPFKKDIFSRVLMSHVLEHLEDVPKTLQEIWRISKPGAIVDIGVPYFSSLNAVKDPTHKHFFAAATFDFFERGKINNYFDKSYIANFRIMECKIIYSNHPFLKWLNILVNLNQRFYERFFAYIFPSQVLEVKLKVVK